MTPCSICGAPAGHTPACAALKSIGELRAALPYQTEIYGRSGADVTAEALGYAACPLCQQRVIHLVDCPIRRGGKSTLRMIVDVTPGGAEDPRPVLVVAPADVERMQAAAGPGINVVAAKRLPTGR